MKVGFVAQRGNARAAALAEQLAEQLSADGVAVVLDETTAAALETEGVPVEEMAARDLVVSIGGDGTFLFAARGAGSTPLLGVNLGEVGFLNAVSPEAAGSVVADVVARYRADGEVPARERSRLVGRGEGWTLPPALNEVVVQGSRRGPGGGVEYTVRVDGSLYAGGRADGLLVATPTGSTAYNLSEGGPLVHPGVDALVLTEMVAADPMRSLLVPDDAEITVTVEAVGERPRVEAGSDREPSGDSEDRQRVAYAVADGRERRPLEPPAEVTVARAADPVRVAGPGVDFFEALGKLE